MKRKRACLGAGSFFYIIILMPWNNKLWGIQIVADFLTND